MPIFNDHLNDRPHAAAWITAVALNLAVGSAGAAALEVEVTLPAIPSAAYHQPYLAAWIEKADDQSTVGTLAVWYDTRLRDGLGKMFLHNLRSWWRKGGEKVALPLDGVSGATRGPGVYALRFNDSQATVAQLPAGRYMLAVEVAREQGGRTVLRTPFNWGGADPGGSSSVAGNGNNGSSSELLALKATVTR